MPKFIRIILSFSIAVILLFPRDVSLSQETVQVVHVGVLKNYPPIYLTNSKTGVPEGFAVDVIEHVGEAIGIKIRYTSFETWPELNEAFRKGQVDLVPNMGMTQERQSFANFTTPVSTFAVNLFVRRDSSDIRGVQDLKARRVAVVRENVGARLMREQAQVLLVLHDSPEQALFSLLSGKADALVYPGPVLRNLANGVGLDERISTVGEPLIEIKRAIAVRKDRPELIARLEGTVSGFVGTPEYQAIFAKWYGKAKPYWDARRVTMSMAVLLVLSVIGAIIWRHLSVVRFNRALAASEARFRDYADAAADWYFEQDEDLRFTFVSERGQDILGKGPDGIIGKTRWDAVQGHTVPEEEEDWQKHRETMEAHESWQDFSYTYVRNDGERRVVSTSAKVIRDEQGAFRGYRGVGRDVTERHRFQEDLILRNKVMEGIGTGILITDARRNDNPIVFSNAAIERLTGYKAAELIGQNPRLLQGDDRDQSGCEKIRKALAAEEPVRAVLRNYRKDGSQFLDEVNIFPVRDAKGALSHFIGIHYDVTAREETEAQLRQAQKMESIGQLTGGVAHDFNNLLTIIVGNLELLADKLTDNEIATDLANEALQAAENGSELSHRLLAFSRQQTLEPKVVDLNHIVLGMQDMLQRTLGETIDISAALSPALGKIRVDPGQLENAILNLAINARDAMPNGGSLLVETTNETIEESRTNSKSGFEAGAYVTVIVTDNGQGMSPEIKERVFDPFFTTKDVGKGSGLGLSMVYGFINQSGGHVAVESKLGSGTKFKLYLPRSSQDSSEEQPAKPQHEIVEAAGETILVVEDDARVRKITAKRLGMLGYTVIEASDGPMALRLMANTDPIDLLFTDFVMPGGMSGLDLVKEVRKRRPATKVLLTSGYTDSENIPHNEVAWLSKPYKMPELAKKVRNVILES